MYDDPWMAQNGFLDLAPELTTAGDVLTTLNREGRLIYLLPGDTLQRAADIFHEHGISQLPVLDNGVMVGAIQEITIVHAQHRGVDTSAVKLRDVMARPLAGVNSGVLLEEIYRLLLSGNQAVAVSRDGLLIGLITRADLMEFYEHVGQSRPHTGEQE
jgi:cystathionine beta-synthase